MCGQTVAFCDGPHVLWSSKEDPQAERAGGLCRGAIGCVAVLPPQRGARAVVDDEAIIVCMFSWLHHTCALYCRGKERA